MTLSLSSVTMIRQEQRLCLSQIIETCNFLSVPDVAINGVLGVAAFNPERIETAIKNIQANSKGIDNIGNRVKAIYSDLNPFGGDSGRRRGGMIIAPDIKALADCFGEYTVKLTPDATFIGKKSNKPEIVFSEHLIGQTPALLTQIDSKNYPETARLVSRLKGFDTWKRETLRDVYVAIGSEQREFFEDFDLTKLNIFSANSLAGKLGLHYSTISRVLSNRGIELRNIEGEQKLIDPREILITGEDQLRINSLNLLNGILDKEFKLGKAYSDEEMVAEMPSVARRTVAKYRAKYGIPSAPGRNRIYQDSKRTEPYKAVIGLRGQRCS